MTRDELIAELKDGIWASPRGYQGDGVDLGGFEGTADSILKRLSEEAKPEAPFPAFSAERNAHVGRIQTLEWLNARIDELELKLQDSSDLEAVNAEFLKIHMNDGSMRTFSAIEWHLTGGRIFDDLKESWAFAEMQNSNGSVTRYFNSLSDSGIRALESFGSHKI